MLLLVGVIPLLYGFLLEVVVLMPVRVPLNQSPVYFIWQVNSYRVSHPIMQRDLVMFCFGSSPARLRR